MPAVTSSSVLVVDDDCLLREAAKAILEQNGYTVREAADGDDALVSLAAHPTDAVLLDIMMPRKDGLETLLELKRRFPHVAVYAMSLGGGGKGHDFLSVAAKFGADGVLHKPFSPTDLLALIGSGAQPPASHS